MSRSERDKGRRGEAEVAAIYREAGLTVRGLEAIGDHVVTTPGRGSITLHSESKRQETARPWAWWAQAEAETEPGAITVVAFRRSRSPWLAMVRLDQLARLVAAAGVREETLRRVPRCSGRTPGGYRCASGVGHRGPHTHPNDELVG